MAKEKVVIKRGQKDSDPQSSDKFKSRSHLRFQSKARWTNSSQWKVSSTWKVSAPGDSMASPNICMAPGDGELVSGRVANGDPALNMPESEVINGVEYKYLSQKPNLRLGRRINMETGDLVNTSVVYAPAGLLNSVNWINDLIVHLAKKNPQASVPAINQAVNAEITRLGGLNCDKTQLHNFIVNDLKLKVGDKPNVVEYIQRVEEDRNVYARLANYLCDVNKDANSELIDYVLKSSAFKTDKTLDDARLSDALRSSGLNTGGHANLVAYIRQNPTRFVPYAAHKHEAVNLFNLILTNLAMHNNWSKAEIEHALHANAFTPTGEIDKPKLNQVIRALKLDTNGQADFVSYIEQYQKIAEANVELDRYTTLGPVAKRATVLPALSELARRDPSGKLVIATHGTVQEPNVKHGVVPNQLFINDKVDQADIQQGSIGDCYFMAALLQVIRYDPTIIKRMMEINGSTVTTRFYRRKTVKRGFLGIGKKREWVQQDIQVNFGTSAIEKKLKGAQNSKAEIRSTAYRVAYDPVRADWTANINSQGIMSITKENLYEAAMWVACMEQAYMVYAREFGQYGIGKEKGEGPKDLVSGISGGTPELCMHLFFGNNIKSEAYHTVKNESGGKQQSDKDLLKNNNTIMKELLALSHQNPGDADYKFITTSITRDHAATLFKQHASIAYAQLRAYNKHNQASPELKTAETLLAQMAQMAVEYQRLVKQADMIGKFREGETGDAETKMRIKIDQLSVQLKNNAAYNALQDSCYRTLEETIGIIVANVHSDNYQRDGRNNLFIYSKHAYSIHSVHLVDQQGQKIERDAHKIYNSIDLDGSKVVLQNPHGRNKAALNEEEKRRGDGSFEISLRSYLNHVSSIQVANFHFDR